jgi:hypothetical protein
MAVITSRDGLIEYCLRRLGEPVLEVNVDVDQVEDKVDDALQLYREFHSDATIKTYMSHLVTAEDVANQYIPISSDVVYLSALFPVASSFGTGQGMFDIRYQMFLNNMGDFMSFAGDLNYFYQMRQYLSLIDQQLHGRPQVHFSRRQNRLYIEGDFNDGDIREGSYLVAEVYSIIDETQHSSVYNDMFIKNYVTSLIKQQWGMNMLKFEGVQLPGGVTINGRQYYDDATQELQALEEKMRSEHELPPDFFVG